MPHSTVKQEPSGPRFHIDKVVITDAASAALENSRAEGVYLLSRHIHGDWGDVIEQDALQNELAILLGLRILSSYTIAAGITIWIITEADRTTTTIMLPDGYQS